MSFCLSASSRRLAGSMPLSLRWTSSVLGRGRGTGAHRENCTKRQAPAVRLACLGSESAPCCCPALERQTKVSVLPRTMQAWMRTSTRCRPGSQPAVSVELAVGGGGSGGVRAPARGGDQGRGVRRRRPCKQDGLGCAALGGGQRTSRARRPRPLPHRCDATADQEPHSAPGLRAAGAGCRCDAGRGDVARAPAHQGSGLHPIPVSNSGWCHS
jgi:hypothetical protein